ncbi:response regulator [Bacillus sp. FJAT-45037]|uniref:response regulator n=1 Tax=Bacillus sp. FJAT-45037 TaxID=2011007 RepID=UPI0012FD7DB4|nr:response regulator [Bacillus sp. FJAT-45037]
MIYQNYRSLNLLFQGILLSKGYTNVYVVDDHNHVEEFIQSIQPDLIIFEMDHVFQFEKLSHLMVEEAFFPFRPNLIGVMMEDNYEMRVRLFELGISTLIAKPINIEAMMSVVEFKLAAIQNCIS